VQRDTWGSSQGTRAAIMQTAQRLRLALYRGHLEQAEGIGQFHEESQPQGGRAHALIEQLMVQVEWGLGKLEDTHTRADKIFEPHSRASNTEFLDVKVVDAHGAPVSRARVVTWAGDLVGDAYRLYKTADFDGDFSVTDDAGECHVVAAIGSTVMAERDDLRSPPTAVPDGKPVTLVVAPAHAIAGKVTGADPLPPLDAFVRFYVVGGGTWTERAPVNSDRSYRIAGVPSGAAMLGLTGDLTHAGHWVTAGPARDGVTLPWPGTATLDVIAGANGNVFVARGHVRPQGKPGSVQIAGATRDWAIESTTSIGFASIRPESQKLYRKGDVHAVLLGMTPGDATVCLLTDKDTRCVDVTVPPAGVLPVVIR
jgi:hypothetical protein